MKIFTTAATTVANVIATKMKEIAEDMFNRLFPFFSFNEQETRYIKNLLQLYNAGDITNANQAAKITSAVSIHLIIG
jgi:hypothetical protein